MSTGEQNLVEGNKAYAAQFTQGDLALPPSQKYIICILPHYHPPLYCYLTNVQ